MKFDGIGPEEIMKSLNNKDNLKTVFKAGGDCFYFFSHDRRFIIKTL